MYNRIFVKVYLSYNRIYTIDLRTSTEYKFLYVRYDIITIHDIQRFRNIVWYGQRVL